LSGESYFKARLRSIRIAMEGVRQVFITQQNARVHVLAALIVFAGGLLFKLSGLEWAVLLLVVGFVWAAEILNTAVEDVVDLVSSANTPAAKRIKDISAGAVLISAVISILVGLIIFGPKLWAWILR